MNGVYNITFSSDGSGKLLDILSVTKSGGVLGLLGITSKESKVEKYERDFFLEDDNVGHLRNRESFNYDFAMGCFNQSARKIKERNFPGTVPKKIVLTYELKQTDNR